jgi:glycosyltransferase involved in cell wall biosynthesis
MKNSVVMASYNGAKYIVTQLDSIKNQTMSPDEVIISDDGSTDSTQQIVKDYISENHLTGWKLIKNTREKGFYNNFFNALEAVSGDIIFLADQDDVWDIHKIEVFDEKYSECKDITMIQSSMKLIDEEGKDIKPEKSHNDKIPKSDFTELSIQNMCKYAGSGFTMSFRKSVLYEIFNNKLDTEERLFKFHDIVIGLMSIGTGRCLLSTSVIDSHRLHDSNVTLSSKKQFWSDRTKNMQLDILRRKKLYFSLLSNFCNNESKKEYFKSCSAFADLRYKYINSFSLASFINLYKNRDLYVKKPVLIVDTLYSLNQEKLLLKIFKLFKP